MFSISLNITIHPILPMLTLKPNTFWIYLLVFFSTAITLSQTTSIFSWDYFNWQIGLLTFSVASSYLSPIHKPRWLFWNSNLKRLQRLPSDLRISTNSFMWPLRPSLTWPLPSFQHHLLLFSLLNCVLPPHQKFFWYYATCTNSYFHFRFIHTRIVSVSIHYVLGLTMCHFNSKASLGASLVSQWYLNAYIILVSITWDSNVLYGSLAREGAHPVPFSIPRADYMIYCGTQ